MNKDDYLGMRILHTSTHIVYTVVYKNSPTVYWLEANGKIYPMPKVWLDSIKNKEAKAQYWQVV